MANEKQRPKKAYGNVEGVDFYYRDNGSKVPIYEATERKKLERVVQTRSVRGKVYVVKNDPKNIERPSVQADKGGGVSVPRKGAPSIPSTE